jgi:EAL domain-containing protein (putative c-di-GMP-specific phosphodiesterase class I)/GGDEF domain-containing protein
MTLDQRTASKRTPPREGGASARIVGRSAFEAELGHRCSTLAGDASDVPRFTLLLLRLRRSDRRTKLLATEGADPVLREVLQRVALELHEDDRVTACSRDEVVVLLAKGVGEGAIGLACDRIFRALGRMSAGATLRPQIGVAMAPGSGRSVEQLLSAVDVACDRATTAHPRIVFATADMADHDDDAHLPALQRVLDSCKLTLAFQPQYDLKRGTWSAIEALVRWPQAPDANPLAPARLIDLAERHGLIDGLTRLILDTAIGHADAFEQLGAQLDIAVNLSQAMMINPALPELVAAMLGRWNMRPRRLILEVTEDSIVRDNAAATGVMQRLHESGVRLSIDDFGTGFSSFARLRDMPLSELKIDQVFVAGMTRRREDLQIVHSVIDLAHNFDLRAVAEGVEDEKTFALLREMGCDVAQGYYGAPPMAAEDLILWWPERPRL